MMQNPLSAAIAKKRADLAKLDRQRDIVAGELRGLEEAARMLESVVSPAAAEARSETGAPGTAVTPLVRVRVQPLQHANASGAGISAEWRPVLADLVAVGPTFNYADMLTVAERRGLTISHPSARAKSLSWRQAGLIESDKPGLFRVTEKGREVAQVQELFQ
jgi:hypothetical protein